MSLQINHEPILHPDTNQAAMIISNGEDRLVIYSPAQALFTRNISWADPIPPPPGIGTNKTVMFLFISYLLFPNVTRYK